MGTIIKRGMVRDVALLLAGAVVYGIGTHCFVTPADIAPGGAMGIALMISHLTGLDVYKRQGYDLNYLYADIVE